jgi:GT2 family glycosyltransferase
MDERYGGYVEDADWSWRARQHGWSSVFVPVPSIIHHEEPEGYEHYSFKSFLLKRNTVLWYLKSGRKISAYIYALASLCLAWLRLHQSTADSVRNCHQLFLRHLKSAYHDLIWKDSLTSGLNPAKSFDEPGLKTWQ